MHPCVDPEQSREWTSTSLTLTSEFLPPFNPIALDGVTEGNPGLIWR